MDFTLIAMREANDVVDYAKLHEVFREVHVVDKDQRTSHDGALPAQVSASESSSLRALITQLSQKLMPDLIQFEYTHFAGFRDCAPGVPALLVEHDLTFSLYRQLAESDPSAAASREYERWLKFERKWLGVYEGVWTVSEEDRVRAIEEGERSEDGTFMIANGVDVDRFRMSDRVAEKPEVFYVAAPSAICRTLLPFRASFIGRSCLRVWSKLRRRLASARWRGRSTKDIGARSGGQKICAGSIRGLRFTPWVCGGSAATVCARVGGGGSAGGFGGHQY